MQSLSDLADSFHLYAVCETCQRQTKLDLETLIERLGGNTQVHIMRSKLKGAGSAILARKIYASSMSAGKTRRPFFSTGASSQLG